MYHGPRGVPRPWGVPWPSRGVPWPLYEEYVLEVSYYIYYRYRDIKVNFRRTLCNSRAINARQ